MTLFCEQLPYTHLAEEFGTPLYVYSKSALTEAFENYQTAFAALNPLVCYAVKANGNLSIIKHFASLGAVLTLYPAASWRVFWRQAAMRRKRFFFRCGQE